MYVLNRSKKKYMYLNENILLFNCVFINIYVPVPINAKEIVMRIRNFILICE